jgi:putative membrane protein
MSTRRLVAVAGALAAALTSAPITVLLSQVGTDSTFQPWRPGGGQTTTQAPARTAARPVTDSSFVREATAGSLLEVRLGNLAQERTASSAVKQFAQRMVTDHTRMAGQWTTLAKSNGLPPTVLDQAALQDVTRLGQLRDAEFDREYMVTMIQDHQRDADTFRSQGQTAQLPQVRQLAASDLTIIQQHLQMAQQVGSTVGANTNVAVAPQAPPPTVSSQNATVPPRPAKGGSKELTADRQFIQEVAADNMLEIRLAQMAQRQASGSDVKRLADRMASDFTKWQDRWTSMASRNGMAFHPGMGNLHRQKVERLQKASKGQFDRVYVRTVIENLQSIVPYFENEGRSARSSEVRNLVKDELPTLKEHLEMAKRIKS